MYNNKSSCRKLLKILGRPRWMAQNICSQIQISGLCLTSKGHCISSKLQNNSFWPTSRWTGVGCDLVKGHGCKSRVDVEDAYAVQPSASFSFVEYQILCSISCMTWKLHSPTQNYEASTAIRKIIRAQNGSWCQAWLQLTDGNIDPSQITSLFQSNLTTLWGNIQQVPKTIVGPSCFIFFGLRNLNRTSTFCVLGRMKFTIIWRPKKSISAFAKTHFFTLRVKLTAVIIVNTCFKCDT